MRTAILPRSTPSPAPSRPAGRALAGVLATLLLAGCQNVPQPRAAAPGFPAAEYERLAAAEGRVYHLDPGASSVRIFVYRGGALAAQGHNHIVTAPRFQGAVFLPAEGAGQARFDLVVEVDELAVDPPAARAAVGGAFGTPLDAEARAGTRDNMLGADVLDARRFPRFSLRALEVAGELPKLAVRTAISLHGVTREQWLPVNVRVEQDRLVASGALVVRQREFGIEPFTAFGGLLRVQDPLMIEFRLVGAAR